MKALFYVAVVCQQAYNDLRNVRYVSSLVYLFVRMVSVELTCIANNQQYVPKGNIADIADLIFLSSHISHVTVYWMASYTL